MASSAQAILESEVRELVRRRGIDPVAEPEVVGRIVEEVVGEYRDRSITSSLPPMGDVVAATRAVLDAVAGFGPLQPLLDDPGIEEIWINEPGRVFIARRGRSELTTLILSADQVAELVERMLRPTGRRIDLSTPFDEFIKSYRRGSRFGARKNSMYNGDTGESYGGSAGLCSRVEYRVPAVDSPLEGKCRTPNSRP